MTKKSSAWEAYIGSFESAEPDLAERSKEILRTEFSTRSNQTGGTEMAARSTAPVKLEIEVSQALIDMATQQTNTRCPVALSLKNADANRIQRPKVDRNEISFGLVDHDVRYVFKTPARVRNFVDAFDTGGRVAPFKFTLDTTTAIDVKPIAHPGAKDVARHAKRREDIAVGARVPRTVGGWSQRSVGAK